MRAFVTTTLFLYIVLHSSSFWGQQAAGKSVGKDSQMPASTCTAVVFGCTPQTVVKLRCKLFAVGNNAAKQAAIDDAKSKLKQEPDFDHLLDPSEAPYRTSCSAAHGAVAGVPAPAGGDFNAAPINDCVVLLYPRFASSKAQAETQAVQDCIDVATHSMPRGVSYFQKNCRVLKSW